MTMLKFPVKDPSRPKAPAVLVPVELVSEGKKFACSFNYCPPLVDEFKNMGGAAWQGFDKKHPRKVWLIDDSARNRFRIDALRWMGTKDGVPILGDVNPYARYDSPLLDIDLSDRPYYGHQPEGIRFVVTRRQCILSWEPGTGKTLVAARAMEWARDNLGWDSDEDFWFVCKNGGLYQVMLDFLEWKVRVKPKFMSYEQMKLLVETWPKGKPAPKFVVFDESTMVKSPTAQRSEKALHLADAMRAEWGPECFVLCMTGTPAPKNPADWWMQAEIACPGFIREGDWHKFRRRLAIVEKREREDGGYYPKVVAWLDDEKRCKVCGEYPSHDAHSKAARLVDKGHPWEASVNEVLNIDKRLVGLVSKKFKRECMDLPDRSYQVVRCRPTQQLLNAAKLLSRTARGAADALTRLRELSDGFQYQDVVVDRVPCKDCGQTGTMLVKEDPLAPGLPPTVDAITAGRLVDVEVVCSTCDGTCEVDVTKRDTARVHCPKDEVIEGLLEEYADVGRLPIYCGFTGTVDRVVDICLKNKWHVLRCDGRGWVGFAPPGEPALPADGKELYRTFRYEAQKFPKVAFVAQASKAGHALNFDNCPTIVNYSRDFNFENGMQGDERNLRGKIKETLAKTGRTKVTVIDIVHLESDYYVLENHKKKRRLQSLTLGEVAASLESSPA